MTWCKHLKSLKLERNVRNSLVLNNQKSTFFMRPVAVTVRVKSLEMGSRSQNSEIELVVEFLDLFISFGMIFWDVILGWYYNILGWKLSKQTSYWSKTGFFFSVKNHNKFSSQNIVISSQNNVPKYHTKEHEQAFYYNFEPLQFLINCVLLRREDM